MESLQSMLILGYLFRQELECDEAVEPCVLVRHAHAALTKVGVAEIDKSMISARLPGKAGELVRARSYSRKSRLTGAFGRLSSSGLSVSATSSPTVSKLALLTQTEPEPVSSTPNEMLVASFGTSSTTSKLCQSAVPFSGLDCMLSNPTTSLPLSMRIHSPAHFDSSPDTASDSRPTNRIRRTPLRTSRRFCRYWPTTAQT